MQESNAPQVALDKKLLAALQIATKQHMSSEMDAAAEASVVMTTAFHYGTILALANVPPEVTEKHVLLGVNHALRKALEAQQTEGS